MFEVQSSLLYNRCIQHDQFGIYQNLFSTFIETIDLKQQMIMPIGIPLQQQQQQRQHFKSMRWEEDNEPQMDFTLKKYLLS